MIKKLKKLSSYLYNIGLSQEANYIDFIIKESFIGNKLASPKPMTLDEYKVVNERVSGMRGLGNLNIVSLAVAGAINPCDWSHSDGDSFHINFDIAGVNPKEPGSVNRMYNPIVFIHTYFKYGKDLDIKTLKDAEAKSKVDRDAKFRSYVSDWCSGAKPKEDVVMFGAKNVGKSPALSDSQVALALSKAPACSTDPNIAGCDTVSAFTKLYDNGMLVCITQNQDKTFNYNTVNAQALPCSQDAQFKKPDEKCFVTDDNGIIVPCEDYDGN